MAKGIYIGIGDPAQISLPDGYTRVEYLESDGGQYINTSIKPNSTMGVEIQFSTTTQYYNTVAVVDLGWETTGFGVGANAYQWGANVNGGQNWADGSIHTVSIDPSGVVADGSSVATFENSSWSIDYDFVLFALNRNGEIQENLIGKIYYVKIKENNQIIRHYIPCINSSNVIGMYDIIEGEFYENLGTGSFIAGPQVINEIARKIKKIYIGIDNSLESPGTQSVAHRIKKIYIGINGVARLCWSE